MGKKDKKKGKGIEKTVMKTEKKFMVKQKKYLAKIGEDDIEKILAQIEEEEKKNVQIKEIKIDKPTRRANFSFLSHPQKDELFLFGGEFFNGQKTVIYNDLLNYNINKNEWTVIQAPNAPPPRCGHQMVSVAKEKGQLWLFGGEFTSPTQNQFYHYKDLWVFHIGEKRWEKILSPDGPSARSGHRMVHCKNRIIVFGGYQDHLRDYKYFNDVYAFDLEKYKWIKIEVTGNPPAPRSGCQMVPMTDGKILVLGGYSKERIKKDVDKGLVHSDMFLLSPDKNDATGKKWKWVSLKQGGIVPTPRSGCSIATSSGNKAYSFGGVLDEESEEDLYGTFFNDLNVLDLEKKSWRPVTLSGKKNTNETKKRRRKIKSEQNIQDIEDESMEESEPEEPETTTVTDGVFTMTISHSATNSAIPNDLTFRTNDSNIFLPPPRMNCGMTVKSGHLYLYGGLVEDGEKQLTLADMYSLDIHKLDEWKIILPDDKANKEWIPSESESGDEENMDDDDDDDDEEEDEENLSDSSVEDMDTK